MLLAWLKRNLKGENKTKFFFLGVKEKWKEKSFWEWKRWTRTTELGKEYGIGIHTQGRESKIDGGDKMHKQGMFEIPYNTTTLKEALHKLQTHDGDGWFDAGRQTVVLVM